MLTPFSRGTVHNSCLKTKYQFRCFSPSDFDNHNNDISSNPFEKNTDDRLDFSTSNPTNFPGVLPPMNSSEPQGQPEGKTSKGDLDSTLSKVAKSLGELLKVQLQFLSVFVLFSVLD